MLNNIKKVLVANRGEIAIRIFRACNELGIKTIAVYSHEDRLSQHKFKADESYLIGEVDQAVKPYLDVKAIIDIAKCYGVDAIHPGYGFLSERQDFVKGCEQAGIKFIGPNLSAMQKLGNKVAAKKVAEHVGVPIIESSRTPLTTIAIAQREAERIGYPIMLKAADGGGGRGMRIIRRADDLKANFETARNESLKAFGSAEVFIEKFIEAPKHVEVQIMADENGNAVHLYERDCSIQRRFQKIVEIAPSRNIKKETKEKLYSYALSIAREVKYSNLGTVEFLVDKEENIYFIEVNPRIQVEHTITEEITQVDLVKCQIMIADGQLLSCPDINIHKQEDISVHGHAIQCRITTEDPRNNFKPDYGTLIAYRNATGFGIRLDEGNCYQGVKISPAFDSLLVKVTSRGRNFKVTIERLLRALREFRIRGVKHNIQFLQNILNHPDFFNNRIDVNFIADRPELFEVVEMKDRATRILQYLANLIVNGHSATKDWIKSDYKLEFPIPVVPKLEKKTQSDQIKGSKILLNELGREGLMKKIKEDQQIHYTDTTFRDAHQSLLATRVRTYDMLRVAEGFSKEFPNVFSMEVWGGATFDVSLRFLNEDPWERLKLLRENIPNILLQMLFRGSNGVGYTAYPDNLIEEFIIKSWENGMDIFRVFDSFNWIEAMKPTINTILNKTEAICQGVICYTDNVLKPTDNKFTIEYYKDLAKELNDLGVHMITIKDMAGLLTPYASVKLIEELKGTVDIPISLHTHDTSSIQSATYLKAIEMGVDVIDVAVASMSGLTSQPNFNSIVYSMQGQPRENPFNLSKLNEYSNYWEDVREYYAPFESGLKSGTAEVYDHEIPGGQYSNLRPQAKSLGLEKKFNQIKKNFAVANRLLGNITKVTPSSKVVGDFALFLTSNDLTEEDIFARGETLSYPESLVNMMKGYLGQAPGGFPHKIKSIVLKNQKEIKGRAGATLPPVNIEKEYGIFKEKFKAKNSYLDFLSYQLYPKVFEKYYENLQVFGNLMFLPTQYFFYPLSAGEEMLYEIEHGKDLMIQFIIQTQPDSRGIRTVEFYLNGKIRRIEMKDENAVITEAVNQKCNPSQKNQIGAPLQGVISQLNVKPGDEVKKDQPLFVIEAMKMESTYSAPYDGVIEQVILSEKAKVKQDDLILTLTLSDG